MRVKDRYIWLLFIILSVVVSACSQEAGTSNQSFDASKIRKEISNLDPDDPEDAAILEGKDLFDKTEVMLPDNVGNEQSCLSCHGDGGLEPNSPMVGVSDRYPREHHGKHTTIQDRINGCFQRSMNGEPLDENSEEMEAIVSYFDFISKDVEGEDDITWRMTNDKDKVPEPDVNHGEELFEEKNCISCHATDGSGGGMATGPPIWGENSFNEAAGMNRINKATAFIQNNIPKEQPGTLTDKEEADLAAYVLSHERPVPDPEEIGDYHLDPDREYITKARREKIRNGEFYWSELDVIKK